MKTSFALIVALIAACVSVGFAQPEVLVLSSRKHCGPQRFRDDIACGCFFASQDPTVTFTNALRTECETEVGRTIAQMEPTCALYLNKGTNPGTRIRRRAVMNRLTILKEQCIRFRQVRFARSGAFANFQILANGRDFAELLNNICALYGKPGVTIPPTTS